VTFTSKMTIVLMIFTWAFAYYGGTLFNANLH
jgi:hypothetical protein